ncbi:MAG: redoxin family protein [Saprospiraceae bacterium]|nr:redoxin family protein [Saprospiraceae bacterium]
MKKLFFSLLLPLSIFAAKAPDFTVTDYNNKTHRLYEDYLNKEKVVVLKIFFVDCPPCNTIAPFIQPTYLKWGAGTGRVQFFELSTMGIDNNAYVKTYANKYGITCPSVGSDGGSLAAVAPYKDNKTFGPWYGTPTFVVIAPNGEVNYGVQFSKSNMVSLDTAIARALRVSSGGPGGGDLCNDSFDIKVLNPIVPYKTVTYDLYNNSNPKYDLLNNQYKCEFFYPAYKDNYVVGLEATTESGAYDLNVSTADILMIQKYILSISNLNNLQIALADVNNNGTISASDISEIRKVILGLKTKFPNGKNIGWSYNPKGFTNGGLTVRVNKLIDDANNEFGFGRYGDVSGAAKLQSTSQTRSTDEILFNIEVSKDKDGLFLYRITPDHDIELICLESKLGANLSDIYEFSANPKLTGFSTKNYYFNENAAIEPSLNIVYCNESTNSCRFKKGETIFSFKSKQYSQILTNKKQEIIDIFENSFAIKYQQKFVSHSLVDVQSQFDQLLISSELKIEDLSIINITQNFTQSYKIGNPTASIRTDNWNPGIYFIKVNFENGQSELKKFLIAN